jgi:hypothetical protein
VFSVDWVALKSVAGAVAISGILFSCGKECHY